MRTHSIYIGLIVLLAIVVLFSASDALARHGKPAGPHGKGFFTVLTDEQREAVHARVAEMRESGASRQEIHVAVGEMLTAYGIELPDDWNERQPRHREPGRRFFSKLTDEQREAVHARVAEMRESGASREEIHAVVGEMLSSYGIELPDDWADRPRGRRGLGSRFMSLLTEEQRDAVRAKRKEMRESGASREETHAAVREMLRGYGIELPDRKGDAPAQGPESEAPDTNAEQRPIQSRNYPNPFNPMTRISYTTEVAGKVKVEIYNVEGDLIRTFEEGYKPAGNHGLSWDGRHANGSPAASGIYFYRVEAGPHSVTNRMILLR